MTAADNVDAKLVLSFDAPDLAALPVAGGKAANLGEMTRAGFPVPAGYCVTTAAYEVVAGAAGLEPTLTALTEAHPDDTSRLADLAAEARAGLLAAPIPDALVRAIVGAYLDLEGGASCPVAVRSSATAEDLPHASFAGQQDTYLNVVGADEVLDAVRRCWASLWTDRAVSYRATDGVDPHGVRLAVVVQRMIASEVAGVLFTANPLTGRRRQAVIDASPGLGEAVVSGMVNPDHFVVDTVTGEILERRIGDKRIAVRAAQGSGTKRVALDGNANLACVSDDRIRSLVELGARVEAHYGTPQDTEWAIDADGGIWVLQARPITTLFPLPEGAPTTDDDLRVYFSFNVAQGVYRPLTPMGLQAFRATPTPARPSSPRRRAVSSSTSHRRCATSCGAGPWTWRRATWRRAPPPSCGVSPPTRASPPRPDAVGPSCAPYSRCSFGSASCSASPRRSRGRERPGTGRRAWRRGCARDAPGRRRTPPSGRTFVA